MKVMKLALLGTAALAAVSVSARADDLADLKAQIEALNDRIATLESAPAVPAGYQLLSMSKAPRILAPGEELGPNDLANVNTIAILPTADVPASTNVQWTGHVKAAFVYDSTEYSVETEDGAESVEDSNLHIKTKAEVSVTGTTDTAVGEVGVFIRWGASADGHTLAGGAINRYYGWWKMTPELSLKGGYFGTLGGIGHGNDKCSCNYTSSVGGVEGTDDTSQFQLAYNSGPIGAAIAIEHHDDNTGLEGIGDEETWVVSGEFTWAGDSFSAEVAGYAGEHSGFDLVDGIVDIWQVGVGATASLDMFTISAAAGMGEGKLVGFTNFGSLTSFVAYVEDNEYWQASLFASANLSDSVSAEVGAGVSRNEGVDYNIDVWGVAGGIYWAPVDKLTIGAEASYIDSDWATPFSTLEAQQVNAALVTIYKF
jgi:hypothetical protein